ncbi:MAG: hypothetical protein ABIJ97_00125 [Bacteroidota bacterium]
MAAETQYTPNTGMVTISSANSNLDGTGTISDAIITAASNGTFVKSITVKAITDTTQGMVRIFATGGGPTRLLLEIEIPAVTKSGTRSAFETTIPMNLIIISGVMLKASTEKAESFNVIVEAQDWEYYSTSVRSESTQYTAVNGCVVISTANSNLDGSGSISTVYSSTNGNILSVTLKAIQNTTPGILRLFLFDGTNNKLFREIEVPAVTKSSIAPAFYHKIVFENGFAIKTGWGLRASTQNAESFNVIADAVDWSYPS